MNENVKVIEFRTNGTCCQLMQVAIDENDVIQDSNFLGGCNGNLQGIKSLIKGMKIDDVIERLQGIQCGTKETSCPDQLAKGLIRYKDEVLTQKV